MIFIDSNIPMYLVGATHAHKIDAQRLLERCVTVGVKLVTNAEVLQEILHRYTAIHRLDAIQPAFEVLLRVVDEVIPVEAKDVDRAKEILLAMADISAGDALHAAIMQRHGIEEILTFDTSFDRMPGLKRVSI